MTGKLCLFASAILLLTAAITKAQTAGTIEELTTLRDSAQVMEVDVFAPKTWEKAARKYAEAKSAVDRGKNQKTINEKISEAWELTENGIKATEVAKLSLQEYLDPRKKAREAKAHVLVPSLWAEAEAQFVKATKKVEEGNVKDALKEAEKASPMYDQAELEAIRADILGDADLLLERAEADEAEKFALSTLDKARSARENANAIITADRYNRSEAIAEATRAEYEARHASNIAMSVRSLNRNDQAWEKLMLVYEIQMNRVGEAIGAERLPFDEGPLAAADTLVTYITQLKKANQRLAEGADKLYGNVSEQLKSTLQRLDVKPPVDDPVLLAETVDMRITDLLATKDSLQAALENKSAELTKLEEQHQQTAAELEARVEIEEKFKQAKALLNPSEGEVLFNSSNDIVLRLYGLSFDIGKASIKDEHIPLLEKVEQAITMFPDAQFVVEGHTDAQGDPSSNVTLSEKRAYAVMQYLRQSLLIPADRISSIGFGSDKPVASNQTKDGRAKNRRIDIIIMQ